MRYELIAGRGIVRDGILCCNLQGVRDPTTGARTIEPAELDKLARTIVAALNKESNDALPPR
jgi:hypothetical protein